MIDYTGLECPICGEKFTAQDDIVVCPECGAPHHRDCCVKVNALLQISTALLRHGSRLKKKPHKKTRKHRARMKSAVHAVESPIPAKRFSATTAVSRSPVARPRRRPTPPQAGFPHSRAFLRKIQPEGLRTARRPLRVPFRAHLAPPLSF